MMRISNQHGHELASTGDMSSHIESSFATQSLENDTTPSQEDASIIIKEKEYQLAKMPTVISPVRKSFEKFLSSSAHKPYVEKKLVILTSEEHDQMKSNPKTKSIFITHGYLLVVQCKICEHPIIMKGSSLGNIGKHLKIHSEEQLTKITKKEKKMVQFTLDQTKSLTKFKSISISSGLLNLFRKNVERTNQIFFHSSLNVPFNDCESIEYRRIFHDSNYIKSRQTLKKFAKEIDTLFNEQVKVVLGRASFVSLAIDIWTTSSRKDSYLAVIAYFVPNSAFISQLKLEFLESALKNNSGQYQCKIVLSLIDVGAIRHTGDDLCAYIISLLRKYDISDKIIAITGDNAGNNKTLMDNLYFNLKSTSLILDDGLGIFMVWCTAHVLNLIAGSMYRKLNAKFDGLLTSIERLAHYLLSTSKIRSDYSEFSKRILPPKNDTRWYSEFLMIDIFVEDYDKIKSFFANKEENIKKKKKQNFFEYSHSELEILKFIVEKTRLFKHFYYVTQNDSKNSVLLSITFYKVFSSYFEDINHSLDSGFFEGSFKDEQKNADPSECTFPLEPSQKDVFECITTGKDKFLNYFDLFSNKKWYFIVDFLTPWSKTAILKSMVSPGKFNAMPEKALKELYSFIRKNSDLVVQNEEKDEVGEDYLFLTYLNRGINLSLSNDDEIAIYLNETRISSPNSIENHAESYFLLLDSTSRSISLTLSFSSFFNVHKILFC